VAQPGPQICFFIASLLSFVPIIFPIIYSRNFSRNFSCDFFRYFFRVSSIFVISLVLFSADLFLLDCVPHLYPASMVVGMP
jgi:hypothetical protein